MGEWLARHVTYTRLRKNICDQFVSKLKSPKLGFVLLISLVATHFLLFSVGFLKSQTFVYNRVTLICCGPHHSRTPHNATK